MKRPLAIVALWYAGGILLSEIWPLPLWPLLSAGIALGAGAVGWNRSRPWLLIPLLGLTGAANLVFHSAILSPNDLRLVFGDKPVLTNVRGRLVETPYQRVRGDPENEQWRSLARIDVRAVQREDGLWQPASGLVMVSTPETLPPFLFKGRLVEINGVLRPPDGPVAEGLFDYRNYLQRLGVYYQLSVRSAEDWKPLSLPSRAPLVDRFTAWSKKTLALGLAEEDEPLHLLWAMTLGWKTALNGEVAEPFMRSGTMHIFAISGLHVALISGILVSLLRLVRVTRAWCGTIVIPLLWAYAYVTGWQASAVRSTVMMSVVIFGWSLRRPSDLLNSLAAAAFLILLWDPQQLFQAGFQLSFFVVLSLALLEPIAKQVRQSLSLSDPFLPRELMPAWKRWLETSLRWLIASVMTSLAAWVGSIPLVAYYFHLVTPISLLANMIVVPLSGFALASNMASLLIGGWWAWAAEAFNHGAWWWMRCMVAVSEWSANAPAAWFYVAAPSLLFFIGYYGLMVSIAAGFWQRKRARICVTAALALVSALWLRQVLSQRSLTRLTVLPLNGGNAIYFKPSVGKNRLLIDCGNEVSAEFVVRPFLASRGVNSLTRLLLTHGDLKHVGGLPVLDHAFKVKEILTSPMEFRSPAYRQIQQQSRETGRLMTFIGRGDHIGPWAVIHPADGDHFAHADDGAVAMRTSIAGTGVLLLSDLGKAGQNVLMNRQPDLRADIVVTGLPTQSEPLAEALLDAVQPKVIIITDAEYPATERASRRLRERLAIRNIPVIYTREAGAVTIEWRGTNCQLHTMRASRLRVNDLPPLQPAEQ